MKIKPIYIYGAIFVLVAIILFFISDSDSTVALKPVDKSQTKMPQDDFHKNLGNRQQQTPNSQNVNEEVIKKLESLKLLADAKPSDTLKIKEYADFLSAAHKPEEAIKYYKKILTIDKNRKDIYLAITYDYFNQKKFDEAEKIILNMIELFPDDPIATYNLGAIEATKGNKEKAREIWLRLISIHPNDETSKLAKKSINEL